MKLLEFECSWRGRRSYLVIETGRYSWLLAAAVAVAIIIWLW